MKLTRKLEIGINAVNALKNKNGHTSVSDMIIEVGTTTNFLEQVMRNLREAGIVSVKRGPGGGYTLAMTHVTAMQVAKAIGQEIEEMKDDASPVSRLKNAVTSAFLNTSI